MSDRYVEKTFLYLLILSVLFHLAVYELIALIPPGTPKSAQGPTMVDLTDLPEPPPKLPAPKAETKRQPDKPQRITNEMPRKVERETERIAPQPKRPLQPSRTAQAPPQAPAPVSRNAEPTPTQQEKREPEPVTRGEGIFKPKTGEGTERSRLFPSAGKLARLEDSYRQKYRREVEDGETRFLNTDDIQFGSFLRRLETAVYGVWHYPQEALMRGIEGTTPVRITFNRNGEITQVDLLETSGSKILDDEVMRTLKQLGPIGTFPRGYTGEVFKLIAFFHYGSGSGRLH